VGAIPVYRYFLNFKNIPTGMLCKSSWDPEPSESHHDKVVLNDVAPSVLRIQDV
jgi:hypothetical protein